MIRKITELQELLQTLQFNEDEGEILCFVDSPSHRDTRFCITRATIQDDNLHLRMEEQLTYVIMSMDQDEDVKEELASFTNFEDMEIWAAKRNDAEQGILEIVDTEDKLDIKGMSHKEYLAMKERVDYYFENNGKILEDQEDVSHLSKKSAEQVLNQEVTDLNKKIEDLPDELEDLKGVGKQRDRERLEGTMRELVERGRDLFWAFPDDEDAHLETCNVLASEYCLWFDDGPNGELFPTWLSRVVEGIKNDGPTADYI